MLFDERRSRNNCKAVGEVTLAFSLCSTSHINWLIEIENNICDTIHVRLVFNKMLLKCEFGKQVFFRVQHFLIQLVRSCT